MIYFKTLPPNNIFPNFSSVHKIIKGSRINQLFDSRKATMSNLEVKTLMTNNDFNKGIH